MERWLKFRGSDAAGDEFGDEEWVGIGGMLELRKSEKTLYLASLGVSKTHDSEWREGCGVRWGIVV